MKKYTINSLLAILEQELNIDEFKMRTAGRDGDTPMARCMFRYFSRHFLNWDEDKISDWLNQSKVSKYSFLKKHNAAMRFDKTYQIMFHRIYAKLNACL